MDAKKKNLLENLRLKTKFGNLKKPRKKPLDKQNRMLAHRRSISVPNLTLVPDEGFSIESGLESTLFFGMSPRLSDSDSVASGSNIEGPIFTEKFSDSVSETSLKVPTTHVDTATNRMSAPVGSLFSEETEDPLVNSGLKGNLNLTQEGLYAQVDKKAKGNIPKFTFEPIPAPRSIFSNALAQSPKPDLPERGSPYGEDASAERVLSDSVSAALIRASSLAEQMSPYTRKRTTSNDQKKSSSEKGTPPTTKKAPTDQTSLVLDTLGTPVESADGTSLDSACGTPNEDRVSMPWMTDSEDLDRDLCSPLFMKEYCAEENLLEGAQLEEALEDVTEMSSEHCDFFDENIIDPLENSMITTGPELLVPAPAQRYLLSINLKQGKNLIIRDKRSGTSDPYVKFKLEGKQLYKSKVVYKSLNPRWNESFSYPLRDREHIIDLRVYNKNRTADEFMGCSTICLKNLDLYKTYEMELCLSDPKKKDDDMGVILVDVCLMFRDATIKKGLKWVQKKNKVQQNQAAAPNQRPVEPLKNQQKNQMWNGVLGITLIEGQDLPQYGQGDIYVRFRLGDQKYKSKNLCIQANPQWREQFDFNQFEDNQEPLQVEVFSKRGRKGEESWGMFEIDLSRLPLNERQLYNHVLDPGKGRLVFLVTLRPCWGVSISDIENSTLEKPDERDTIEEKFSLKNSHKYMEEIGFLQVKVIKANDLPATDLNKKSNPLCVVELANSKLQTHTIYKTVNPEWSKVFTFPIKDIHDVIKLTVLDDNGDKAPNFLGNVAIPLLNVQNGQQICLLLKKEDLVGVSKGTITLVLEVIYNKVRAGIRTFKPKETKLMEENTKFSKKVLAQNIYRVRKISTAVLYTLQYINSCFQWESVQRSLIAFLIFLATVWHWELFMLPLFLLLLLGWQYFQLSAGKTSTNQDLVNMSMGDDDEEDEKEAGKKGLMDKIHMVQEVVLVVQNVLEEIANIGERIKNMFNWSVPFLSCLACLVLFVGTMLLYFIPLRYIVLIWGVNKFTKKLRNPYTIDNNEILNFLKRVPSDVQKSAEESCQGVVSGAGRSPFPDCEFFLGQEMKCHTGAFISQVQNSALRAPTSQNQPRRKK